MGRLTKVYFNRPIKLKLGRAYYGIILLGYRLGHWIGNGQWAPSPWISILPNRGPNPLDLLKDKMIIVLTVYLIWWVDVPSCSFTAHKDCSIIRLMHLTHNVAYKGSNPFGLTIS